MPPGPALRPAVTAARGSPPRVPQCAFASAGVLAAVLVSACAASPTGPDQAAQQFFQAIGDKDTAKGCSLMAYDGRPLAGDDLLLCRSGFDALVATVLSADELEQLRSATVTAATVEGDTATIPQEQVASDLRAALGEIGLVRVSDRWYVNTRP